MVNLALFAITGALSAQQSLQIVSTNVELAQHSLYSYPTADWVIAEQTKQGRILSAVNTAVNTAVVLHELICSCLYM